MQPHHHKYITQVLTNRSRQQSDGLSQNMTWIMQYKSFKDARSMSLLYFCRFKCGHECQTSVVGQLSLERQRLSVLKVLAM